MGTRLPFQENPSFQMWLVNSKHGGVKRDTLGYTLVDLNNLGHKNDPFILASQARQVFYVKDQVDKKLSIVFKTLTKNYKDTYDDVDEEFSTVIHEQNDNILPRINPQAKDAYYRADCEGIVIRKSKWSTCHSHAVTLCLGIYFCLQNLFKLLFCCKYSFKGFMLLLLLLY